jgi:hypothetical protein
MARSDLTEALDELIKAIDTREQEQEFVRTEVGSPVYAALCLAQAVCTITDLGGGILKLASGEKFRLVHPCIACEVAVPLMGRSGIDSKFCPRCANTLAAREWRRQQSES